VGAGDACTEYIDDLLAHVADCFVATAAQRQDAIEECQMGPTNPRTYWRPEFGTSVDECGAGLSCDEYLDNLDDLCFPPALAAHATGLLSDTTITACISGQTDTCVAELMLGRETNSSVVATCFRRWNECSAELVNNDPYWTEDHCGTLIALPDDRRAQAEPCLTLPCTEVAACLINAGAFNF
jgi:hypothetical protein